MDQFYPSVHSNNSFTLNKCYWNSVEMSRITLVVFWTHSTYSGYLVGMCRLTFALLRIKYTDGFILILILLVQEKCHWNSVEMCRMTLMVVSTNFYPWLYSNNSFISNKSSWNLVEICRMSLAVLWIEYTLGFI